jgi:sugar/nucleoside kinase (ribokinase family)
MLAIVASPSPSEQHFILYHGADALLRPDELPRAYIEAASVFCYGSVTLSGESREATMQAARWARQAGGQVIFDVNLRPALWPDLETARQQIQANLSIATVVKLNEGELAFLTGIEDPAQGSQALLAQGVELCCVSLGADGAYFRNGVASGHVPVFAVDVVDTTGSGDAFVAGLAYGLNERGLAAGLLDEDALRDMIRLANACGALAATRLGAMSSLPNLAEVRGLLERR